MYVYTYKVRRKYHEKRHPHSSYKQPFKHSQKTTSHPFCNATMVNGLFYVRRKYTTKKGLMHGHLLYVVKQGEENVYMDGSDLSK